MDRLQTRWFLVGLVGLMAATRFHCKWAAIALPDASLAVFFLAGLYLPIFWVFGVLLLEAGLIDYLAIAYLGVSSWCISPAYIFLIPTYAVMWEVGRRLRRFEGSGLRRAGWRMAGVVAATTVAFLISSGSFYMFSGRFPEASWVEYAQRVTRFYPHYLGSTLLYTLGVFGLHILWRWLAKRLKSSIHPLYFKPKSSLSARGTTAPCTIPQALLSEMGPIPPQSPRGLIEHAKSATPVATTGP